MLMSSTYFHKFIRFTLGALLAAALTGVCGCSTIEGMGKDLQSLGRAMEKKDGAPEQANSSTAQPTESAVTTPIK